MTKIDVRECEHYWNTHNLELCKINFDNNYYSNGLPLAEKCSEHKDCYYKQLKRLEAENAKLKEALEKIKVMIEPCKASDSCFTCKFDFCANYEIAKILKEVLE